VGVVALVPLTARLHARRGATAFLGLVPLVVGLDALRLFLGDAATGATTALGLAGSALVWVACHQLGYLWRDWTGSGTRRDGGPVGSGAGGGGDDRSPADPRASRGTGGRCEQRRGPDRRGVVVLLGGLGALVGLTQLGPYPVSMVAVRGEELGNMFPTTACIAALAVLQLGVVLVGRDALGHWLQRRSVWRTVVMANGVAMTVFCWHMTALVGFLLAYQAAGFTLGDQPTATWWLTRPVWLAGPALVLAGLVAVFARFEVRAPGRRRAA
jgi:hypothetical protein